MKQHHMPTREDVGSRECFPRAALSRDAVDAAWETAPESGNGRAHAASPEPSWLLKPAGAAALLNISQSRVYELMASGVLPSITIGTSRRIRRDELWAWLEAQSR